MNYQIDEDEVILYEGLGGYKSGSVNVTNANILITSKKIVIEKESGIFKKSKQLVDSINLSDIKVFNNELQSKQKGEEIFIQCKQKNLTLSFGGMLEARKANTKIIDATTGTTMAKRGSEKVKDAINLVDETLGLDTKGITKGIIENGVVGTLINGIKKKDKK